MRRNPARTRRSGAVAAGLRRLSRTVVVDALRFLRAGLQRPLRATRTEHRAAAERGRADEGRRCQVEWIHRVLFSMPHMPAQARFLPDRFMKLRRPTLAGQIRGTAAASAQRARRLLCGRAAGHRAAADGDEPAATRRPSGRQLPGRAQIRERPEPCVPAGWSRRRRCQASTSPFSPRDKGTQSRGRRQAHELQRPRARPRPVLPRAPRRGAPRPLRQPVLTIARVAGSGGSVDARGASVDARSAAGERETANDRRHCHRSRRRAVAGRFPSAGAAPRLLRCAPRPRRLCGERVCSPDRSGVQVLRSTTKKISSPPYPYRSKRLFGASGPPASREQGVANKAQAYAIRLDARILVQACRDNASSAMIERPDGTDGF
jgi:hypothetical protein